MTKSTIIKTFLNRLNVENIGWLVFFNEVLSRRNVNKCRICIESSPLLFEISQDNHPYLGSTLIYGYICPKCLIAILLSGERK
jgi:Zn finger protein HypA/HybF involved in hydrogenase expression